MPVTGVGTSLLRNVATIGGHLARSRLSDIVPTLLALDATVTVYDGKERTMPLATFYAEGVNRQRLLRPLHLHLHRPRPRQPPLQPLQPLRLL